MLDGRPDEFDHRNLFLHALLGIISASRSLDAALLHASDTQAAPVPDEDPWLLCVLGLVAFRLRVAGHLDGVEAPAREPTPERPAASLTLRGILR